MKNLAKALIVMSILFAFTACKKDKNENPGAASGTYTYLGNTVSIVSADYRGGDGDGAWIYMGDQYLLTSMQIRFQKLGDYEIPIGTFEYADRLSNTYNPAKNFSGGAAGTNSMYDEINGGTVTIAKDGDNYIITINATTTKGPLKGSFKGTLKKI